MNSQTDDRKLLVEAVVKGVVCVVLVGVVAYSVYSETQISPDLLAWIASVLAVYFGQGSVTTMRRRGK